LGYDGRLMPVICRHFGVCGGCQSQDVAYPEQLARKRRALQYLLRDVAGPRPPRVEPVVGMPVGDDGMPRHFRHKASFVFAPADRQGRGLVMGHYASRSRRVVPVVECPVHSVRANQLAFALRDHLARAQVTAAGPRLEGIVRYVVIRTSHDDREALVLLVVTRNDKTLRKPLRAFLAWEGRPDGLFVTVHDRDDPYMVGDVLLRIDGRTHIRETRLGPTYLLSPTAFFQTNPDAAAAMVDEVVSQAAAGSPSTGGLRVLDLYAGSGLFALPLARAGHTVTAVEENRQAVNDGIANAQLNRIPQTRVNFVTARTEDYLRRLRATPDFVVLDPPRQGCAPSVIQCVFVELRPPRVIYVSCNPEAFARELPAMLDAGYHVDRVLPVDMFPHTNHVELVATLSAAEGASRRSR
jgi:23S rRNA (uracil1939-C5)-methyltransferase